MTKSGEPNSQVVESLSLFIRKLNDEVDALVVVEGLRDSKALRDSGFDGAIFMLCHNQNVSKLEAEASKFRKTILLLDNDSEGKKLAERTRRILSGRVKIDLYYQKELLPASRGKIRHIEELSNYASKVSRHA